MTLRRIRNGIADRWRVLMDRPRVLLVLLALIAIPIGALVVAATPPDPGARQLALSWQGGVAAPVPNLGVDAGGLTLEQWTRGFDSSGRTLEQWQVANPAADPRSWVASPASRRRPEDWRPLVSHVFVAGQGMWTLRFMEFRNKMAEPMIHRRFVCGAGVHGISDIPLEAIWPPTATDGAAVKNHFTRIPLDILPPGVTARQCEYRVSAEFVTLNPLRTATLYFPPVPVTIVAPQKPS